MSVTGSAHAARVSIRFEEADQVSTSVRCRVDVHDPALHGHTATFRITRTVAVHDGRGIDRSHTPIQRKLGRLGSHHVIEIPRETLQLYSYRGSMIDIAVRTELVVDDRIFSGTRVEIVHDHHIDRAPAICTDVNEVVEPHDAFDLVTNLQAIPPRNRMITIGLLLFGLLVIGFNTWVGWHDQISPETEVWFYDHYDSDGESESPLMKSLFGSGAIGVFVWAAVIAQLRKYMTFELVPLPARIGRSHSIPASKLVRGRSRIDLHDVQLRIVACNMEKGQYKRGSGTKERTVSFSEPVRAVVLYDQRIKLIPADRPVEHYLGGDVRFEPMFRALYPPQMLSSTHGVALHWEIQLIHDELVDQELVCPCEPFIWEEFLQA
jgi:hypothetical protein